MEEKKYLLTQYSKGGGCGCKIAPNDLHEILYDSYTRIPFPGLLVGNDSHDDAAVLDIGNNQLLISTTDFFMPIVDDAYEFGRIAAANALSDVYVMGGKPVLAIGVLGWPIDVLPNSVAREVIKGANSICDEAEIPLAGGHSINAMEPFFGLAVNGITTNQLLKKNSTAQPGDIIYITKPLGTGVLATALKRGKLNTNNYNQLIQQLTKLNKEGEKFGTRNEVHAMTDITGFSLMGHLLEVCKGSNVAAQVNFAKIPVMNGFYEAVEEKAVPGNTKRNFNSVIDECVGLNEKNMFALCDPQTNGGIMVCVKELQSKAFEDYCLNHNITIYEIGKISQFLKDKKRICII